MEQLCGAKDVRFFGHGIFFAVASACRALHRRPVASPSPLELDLLRRRLYIHCSSSSPDCRLLSSVQSRRPPLLLLSLLVFSLSGIFSPSPLSAATYFDCTSIHLASASSWLSLSPVSIFGRLLCRCLGLGRQGLPLNRFTCIFLQAQLLGSAFGGTRTQLEVFYLEFSPDLPLQAQLSKAQV